ncbi:MAG: S-methyl-5-thioribose-1-phosphate isomerase [Gammaproteobacteria bacterium]|nr:S-methyl-5-thioribose-1-phosphate isomerase [Gammaproteobacteria bacterium]
MTTNDAPRIPLRAIQWKEYKLHLIDQRQLPTREEWLILDDATSVANAISDMAVRGAPAIGIAAAYGLVLGVKEKGLEALDEVADELAASRPTAVNLQWALQRMRRAAGKEGASLESLEAEAKRIHAEDIEQNRTMAALGAAYLLPGSRILTHCNTGALATAGIGTALGVIRQANIEGKLAKVMFTETRPWMQGARLTAWELAHDGIRATLLTEGAVAGELAHEGLDWLIVGADRIAANGDTANKVGTFALAIMARQFGAKVMVVAPSGTVDMSLKSGADIPIEYRDGIELLKAAGMEKAPDGITVANPAFDITPAQWIDVIVTEQGTVEKPGTASMRKLLG